MTTKKPKFLRRTWNRYSKLGKKRKKKQVWRSPKGRDNKMREKRKGYTKLVSIGYKNKETKKPVIIRNIGEIKKMNNGENALLGKIGKKKKIEIVKIAKERKINFTNMNINKFLKTIDKKLKSIKTDKETKTEKVAKK